MSEVAVKVLGEATIANKLDTEEVKPKKIKEVVRPNEDLMTVEPKKMTDKEKINFIKFLKEENDKLDFKCTQLDESCKSAFAKANELEKKLHLVKSESSIQLQMVKDNVRIFANNMMTILKNN